MKKFIESPFADGKAALHITPKKMIFRKDEFDVYDYYYVCEVTKNEFATNEASELTLKQLYNQYREKHNILFPDQIKQLREQYDLSPQKMSEVLGFGENVYRQYEKGEIPNKSNAKTLNLVKHHKNFIELANDSGIFAEFELNNLKILANNLEEKLSNEYIKRLFRNYTDEIDQFTGYSMRSYKKFANLIIFFLNENNRAFTTRLNKYLFYSDFMSFKYFGSSISGYTYCAIDNGPVLDNYKKLFSELWLEEYVDNIEQKVGNKDIEKFVPKKPFDVTLFTKDEMDIMIFINKNLKFKRTEELINMSHLEKGWIENIGKKGSISYQKYAPLLSL
jgi:DNA-binding transcriptional regulator YiaG